MEEGWVYVLVNSSTPGMAKVGRTTRAPGERAAELSGVTGVATPFIVAYEQFFADCHSAERAVHAELDRRGWRVARNREFFRGSPSDIIRVLLETGDAAGFSPPARHAARQADMAVALLEAGDQALFGLGDALQNTGEAVRCYKLAALRGSSAANERLGGIFIKLYAARHDNVSRRRALAPLKEGARRGNLYCYCTMSELFALDGHRANFDKAWHLFFTGVVRSVDPEAASAFASACARYIGLCLDMQTEPAHLAELRSASDAILLKLLAELDRARADCEPLARIAGMLRWTYAALLPQPAAVPRKPAISRFAARWLVPGRAATA